MKLPPAAQVSIIEAKTAFRLTVVASNLSANLVAPLMYALQVVEQAGDNSRNCHLYDVPIRLSQMT